MSSVIPRCRDRLPASTSSNTGAGSSLSFFGTNIRETDAENPQVNR
jgi:hypothetical protein